MRPTDALLFLGEEHEGHALTLKSIGATWEGDDRIDWRRLLCSCGSTIVVEIRTDVGPPGGV